MQHCLIDGDNYTFSATRPLHYPNHPFNDIAKSFLKAQSNLQDVLGKPDTQHSTVDTVKPNTSILALQVVGSRKEESCEASKRALDVQGSTASERYDAGCGVGSRSGSGEGGGFSAGGVNGMSG